MSFLFTLKIKFSSKFCKTRVNLAYTASKICSIMNSFIRDWTKRTSSLLSLKLYTRVIAQDFLECVLLNRLGGHSPRKPEQEKRFSKTRIWWLKPLRLFFYVSWWAPVVHSAKHRSALECRTSLSEDFDDCFDMSIWNRIKSPLDTAEMHLKSGRLYSQNENLINVNNTHDTTLDNSCSNLFNSK